MRDADRLVAGLQLSQSEKFQSPKGKKEESVMPILIATHEVDDVAHWLASPKREEVFANVATNITTFVLSFLKTGSGGHNSPAGS